MAGSQQAAANAPAGGAAAAESTSLLFTPFSSQIELPFYSALFSLKLEHDKLDDSARFVLGLYEPRGEQPRESTRLQVHGSALASTHVPLGATRAEGIIRNFNTIEAFKQADKSAILQTAARQIWDAIKDGSIYEVPSLLSAFTILSFADLKKYRFTYWFAFPALHSDPLWRRDGPTKRFSPKESTALVERVGTWRYSTDNRQHGFFLVKKVRGPEPGARAMRYPIDDPDDDIGFRWEVASLRDFENGFFRAVAPEDQYVAFVDPSTYAENPSWPLRNLLVLIRQRYHLKKVQILSYRDTQARRDEARSLVFPLAMDDVESMEVSQMPKATGWERHSNGKLQARTAHLAEYMDPARLADQAVDLNLKLMKWRIAPQLDLDSIKKLSCLLLGAGTLGSYVARNLLGWGVRKITFVDNGNVSFSNPVRQPLFEFEDCLHGGAPKATRAAEALRKIYPGVTADGHVLSVPMLGHPIMDAHKTKADFDKLEALIQMHDVIFLLMDTRESRWLPTVMGKAAGKIVMNAAIGFDTFVVMRHGAVPNDGSEKTLGCYFCNDVVAPADSIKDQTLDQQCTVTRPGVASMASALLVELLTSVLQHPLKQHAPAPRPQQRAGETGPSYEREPEDHPLGLVPHQIRGFVSEFRNMLVHGESYPFCSACSTAVVYAYKTHGWGFVEKALGDREYVTELSGLAAVQREAEKAAAELAWSDDESEEDDDGEPVLLG